MDWIKLWIDETLFGTTSKELSYEIRGVWFQLLTLAGKKPCYGQICIAENLPYSNEQLSMLLNVPIKILEKALKTCQEVDKIKINKTGIIEIVNWGRYQSQAGYMQTYRKKQEVVESKKRV